MSGYDWAGLHARLLEIGGHTTDPDLVNVCRLDDGSVLYKYADGSWVIDVPAMGRHQLVAQDGA